MLRNGSGGGPTVAVQAHLDMVCEKEPDVIHDFEADPIRPQREGDRISARGTTLGADNGIGVAAALTLISDREVRHGPLELVFTVDEESGRWGALDLDESLLTAPVLINLDSEDSDALTIGAAGGADVEVRLPVVLASPDPGMGGAELSVSGLVGGHSGLQIHEPRANAIKVLAEGLEGLRSAGVDFRLASIEGGSAHNAIPRGAVAGLAIETGGLPAAEDVVASLMGELRASWAETEPGMVLELRSASVHSSVITEDAEARLLELLRSLPHGVLANSERFAGVVDTSANLAVVETGPAAVTVLVSVRSLSDPGLRVVQADIRELAGTVGAGCKVAHGYPAWEPRAESPLTQAAVAAYKRTYGREPRMDILHAGLECGAFVSKKPDLDVVSFGPRIEQAHTPKEHVYASTVTSTWELLVNLLGNLAEWE